MTTAGELRERIAFDELSAYTDDGYGNAHGEWEEQFIRSAKVSGIRGGENVIAQRLTGIHPVIIRVRSSTETREISPGWRARDTRTGAVYNIRDINPDEKKQWIDILAEAGAPVEEGA